MWSRSLDDGDGSGPSRSGPCGTSGLSVGPSSGPGVGQRSPHGGGIRPTSLEQEVPTRLGFCPRLPRPRESSGEPEV